MAEAGVDYRSAALKVVVAVVTTIAVSMWGEWREAVKAQKAEKEAHFETLDSYREYIESVMKGEECPPCEVAP